MEYDQPLSRLSPGPPLRILFAIDNLRPGGAQKVLRDLLARLDRDRYDPAIWCLGGSSDIEAWFAELNVPVVRYPEWQMRCGVGPARMVARLRRWRPAVVQTFLWHADCFGRVAARLAGVPAVVSCFQATNVDKPRWKLWLDRLTAPLADAMIAVSAVTRDFAVAHEGARPERTVVVPNGIDVDAYHPSAEREQTRRELGYAPDDFVVGTLGRLREQKGQAYLVDAFAALAERLPRLRGFIAGYGPLEADLRRRIEAASVGDRLRLLGYRADVARLLAAMDLFVLPSLWEGVPLALLEAMAMALPAVATDIDGNRDLVVDGETGVLVPPRDSAALADAIARLAGERDRVAAMGRRGRELAAERFSAAAMAAAYQDLYARLLRQKGVTRAPAVEQEESLS